MIENPGPRAAVQALRAAGVGTALLAAACVSYTPQELAVLSPVELCALQAEQRVNLTGETRERLQAELQRRRVECALHATELALRRDARLQELTYGVQDDP